MGRPPVPVEERFWTKVAAGPNGCIIWTASVRGSNGYGATSVNGKNRMAHRVAWELTRGPIPEGVQVNHRCDVPRCVNPEHLYLGSHADNMQDKTERGRGVRGSQVRQSKLTEDQVRDILKDPRSLRVLARECGVTFGAIAHIRAGRNWGWLRA